MEEIRAFFKRFIIAICIGAVLGLLLQWFITSILMVVASAIICGLIVYILIHVYFPKKRNDNE